MATERIIEHLDRLREKPQHVRHQIAMATAFGITSLVALGWVTALATSGTLALKDAPAQADGADQALAASVQESSSAFSNLMGAAGAAFTATSTEAALRIIDTRTSSTLDARSEPANATSKTVIPF